MVLAWVLLSGRTLMDLFGLRDDPSKCTGRRPVDCVNVPRRVYGINQACTCAGIKKITVVSSCAEGMFFGDH